MVLCNENITSVGGKSGPWKHGESVELRMITRNGGRIGLLDHTYSKRCSYPYSGKTRTHSVTLSYDDQGPVNSECPKCRPPRQIMDIGSSYTKQPKVSVAWKGWTDGPAGVGKFKVNVYKLKSVGGVLKEDKVISQKEVVLTNSTTDITLPERGLYSFILEVKDKAEPQPNVRLARRFVMFDNESRVTTNPSQPMKVETANINTPFNWLTTTSDGSEPHANVSVSWRDHFQNTYQKADNLLGSIYQHTPAVDPQYDLSSGQPPLVRSAAAIPNSNAIYKFKWAVMVNPDYNKPLQAQASWESITNFQATKTIPVARAEGDAIAFLVRAYDIMDNYLDDYVFAYVDTSPPILENLRILWKQVNGTDDKYDLVLAFEAYDYHSGLSEVHWNLVDSRGTYSSEGYVTPTKLKDKNAACNPPGRYCTRVDLGTDCLCSSFEVKSPLSTSNRKRRDIRSYDYSYTVTVTNGVLYKSSDMVQFNATSDLFPPGNIQAAAVSATAIKVTWRLPAKAVNPGTNVFYTARLRDNYFGNMSEATVEGFDMKEAVVSGLRPYWNYTAYVLAFSVSPSETKKEINGTNEAPASTLQSPPGPVRGVDATSMMSENLCHSVRVTWQEPSLFDKNGVITGYVVTGTADDTRTASKSFSAGDRSGVIPYVDPNNVKYTFSVQAQTAVGTGAHSVDQPQVQTGKCAPANFTQPEVAYVITNPGAGHKADRTHQQIALQLDDAFFNTDDNGIVQSSGIIAVDTEKFVEGDNNIEVFPSLISLNSVYTTWAIVTQDPPYKAYRATPDSFSTTSGRRKRALESGSSYYSLGAETCSPNQLDIYCDGYLQSEHQYRVKAFKCTAGGCRVTQFFAPQFATTTGQSILWIAAAVIVPLAVIAVVVVVVCFVLRRRGKKPPRERPRLPVVHYNVGMTDAVEIEDNDNFYTMETGGLSPDPIRTSEFVENVSLYHQDGDHRFKEEFKLLKERSPQHQKEAATDPNNKDKNRYQNTLPYDHSRVTMEAVYDTIDGNADYINASFIPGPNVNPEYIAAQGPLQHTVLDFWRMIWELEISVVVMITKCEEKGKEKCYKYWPQERKVALADLRLQLKSEDSFGYYTIRTINVRKDNENRLVKQFQFMDWPEVGVPEDPSHFLDFMQTVRGEVAGGMPGPLLVHCSTGTSRTGVFIAVNSLLHTIRNSPTVDIFKATMDMRDHRCNMIAAEGQYIFVFDCVKAALEKGIYFEGIAQADAAYDDSYYTVQT